MSSAKTQPRIADSEPAGGFVLVNGDGQVVQHSGAGSLPAIRALARTSEWVDEIRSRRMTTLRINGDDLVLIYYPLKTGYMVLVHPITSFTVQNFVASVDFAFDIFEHILSDPYDAMTVVDDEARLRFISPVHEKFFGLKPGEYIGKPVQQVIENTRLDRVVEQGKGEFGQIQHMRGADRVVTRTPIKRGAVTMGAIGRIMFKNPSQVDDLNRKINSLESELEFYRRETDALRRQDHGLDDIVGESEAIRYLKESIIQVAPLDVAVLIYGESGVGKELVAHAIHRLSPRRNNPHVIVNAAAMPATLVESELFGYTSGAFTGAHQRGRAGKFEQANTGTIFLDEIGDMPMDVQAKLLRVIQEGTVDRLGGEKPVKLDFRLVTATNRDLMSMVSSNEFRLDLYYRISPLILEVPPLRDRKEDIEPLATHFVTEFSKRHGRKPVRLDASAIAYLEDQTWPGNIRQLKHEIERALILFDGTVLTADILAGKKRPSETLNDRSVDRDVEAPALAGDTSLQNMLDQVERQAIIQALQTCEGNKKQVAERLNISRSYLYKRLKAFELE